MDLQDACLSEASLDEVNLRGANLHGANLLGANLYGTNLSKSDLSGANLYGCDLCWADLSGANLSGAKLSGADLRETVFIGSIGLLSTIDWMDAFEKSTDGWIVYKRIGKPLYVQPKSWRIEPGAILTEVVNPIRTSDCACGVNFGTRAWCDTHYTDAVLWRCLIRWEWGPGIVVPYNTDGKARCERLQLLEVIR